MRTQQESPALAEQVDRWLGNGRGWRHYLCFPAALQRRYEADTRQDRARTAGLICVAGLIVGLLFYPVLNEAVPDMHALAVSLYLQTYAPCALLVALLVLLDLPPPLREALLVVPSLMFAGVLTYLFAHTAADATELYVIGILTTLVFACVALQLRFPAAVVLMIFVIAMYAGVVSGIHNFSHSFSRSLILVIVAAGGYILFGNWRIHADQRHLYALMLRERLRRDGLTERNRELDELVRQDALTGLANRRAYDAWLYSLWHAARATQAPVGLIMLDIDRFKAFNDMNGHPAGDACLREVAACLRRECAATSEHLARLGGEEFALLLPGHNVESCAVIAERLRKAVENLAMRHNAPGVLGVITVSCGAASMLATEGAAAAELCAAADAALYRAKQAGRNRVQIAPAPVGAERATQLARLATALLARPM